MTVFKNLGQFVREELALDDVYLTKDEHSKLLDRIENLEIEKELPQWDLKKFCEEFQFIRIRDLTSRQRKIFVRLLQPKCKLPIAIFDRSLFKGVNYYQIYYQICDDTFVGQIWQEFVKNEREKDAENQTPAEAGA